MASSWVRESSRLRERSGGGERRRAPAIGARGAEGERPCRGVGAAFGCRSGRRRRPRRRSGRRRVSRSRGERAGRRAPGRAGGARSGRSVDADDRRQQREREAEAAARAAGADGDSGRDEDRQDRGRRRPAWRISTSGCFARSCTAAEVAERRRCARLARRCGPPLRRRTGRKRPRRSARQGTVAP